MPRRHVHANTVLGLACVLSAHRRPGPGGLGAVALRGRVFIGARGLVQQLDNLTIFPPLLPPSLL